MALASAVGPTNLAVQGVNSYSASVDGYLAGGDAKGSTAMAEQIRSLYAKCPGTKLVVGGYSQGGQLVHNALGMLDATTAGWVGKVVIFGDPCEFPFILFAQSCWNSRSESDDTMELCKEWLRARTDEK
jgi:cutinase